MKSILAAIKAAVQYLLDGFIAGNEWLSNAIDAIIDEALTIPTWIWRWCSYSGAAIITVVVVTTEILGEVLGFFGFASSTISTISGNPASADAGPMTTLFGQINMFIPLSEFLAFLLVYINVILLTTGVRIVRSWFPGSGIFSS